jgi:nicotinamide-nucleotide adenylyltransferase
MALSALPSHSAFIEALYTVPALRRYTAQITRIREAEKPDIEIITPSENTAETAPLLVLPGSYNPPTTAHLALAEASLQAIPGAHLSLALGTTITDKEQTERATLIDRLLLLDQIARRIGRLGVLLTNRGLYVEQAEALHAAFPHAIDLCFVVGFDKIEQIFDARYYQDRDAALRQLFSLARLLVAPRANHEAADIAALMNRPDNQPFQASVQVLSLPVDYRSIASSQIRAALQANPSDLAASPLAQFLPPEALAFCIETGCYLPAQALPGGEIIDRYGIRTTLIARALALPEAEQSAIDLRRLFHLATSDTNEGHRLRRWLDQPEAGISPRDLCAF